MLRITWATPSAGADAAGTVVGAGASLKRTHATTWTWTGAAVPSHAVRRLRRLESLRYHRGLLVLCLQLMDVGALLHGRMLELVGRRLRLSSKSSRLDLGLQSGRRLVRLLCVCYTKGKSGEVV